MKPGKFLAVPEHTGLILCADGVPLFKSSKGSFWPVLLMVTSLPPDIRMNVDIILAGVWQGPVKPPMDILLPPVLDKIDNLKKNGISVQTCDGPKTVRACLIMSVFDLPAKAAATNMVQYNGYNSCTYCLDAGEHFSGRHIFLPESKHEDRTVSHLEQCAMEAEASGNPVCGVKGSSVLSAHIDITKSVVIDYMHAILEGVTETVLSACLDSKHNACSPVLLG